MKRVRGGSEPEILATFRARNPNATWSEFKNEPGSNVVFDGLAREQGFICAYCEMRIGRGLKGQVEHFEPKSSAAAGRNLHLEFANLLACCEGGTWGYDQERSALPISDTQHCGALKGDLSPHGRMLDPRLIPGGARLWNVSSNSGHLTVNREACIAAGVDPELATSTLAFLGLNRIVLTRHRAALIAQLDQDAFAGAEESGSSPSLDVAIEQMLPDASGHLVPYWSTIRAWAGPQIEPFIEANRDRIPGLSD